MNHFNKEILVNNSDGICVIDICGTLYDANTTMTFLDYTFVKNRKYKIYRKISKTIFFRILNKLLFSIFRYDYIRYCGIRFLKGMSEVEIKRSVDRYYENYLRHKIKIESIIILKEYQIRKDCHVVIVSATLDCIARKVAEEMGIDEYISSKLAYKDEVCLGFLDSDLLNNKLKALKKMGYYAPYKMTLSDNFSDADIMALSKESFIVCCDTKMQKWKRIINYKQISKITFVINNE